MLRDLRRSHLFLLFILLAAVLLGNSAEVLAAQWIVSKEGNGGFRTIQGAIDAAHYGDSIYVNPGVYEEQVTLRDGIHLTGAGPEHTVVRFGYGFDEVLSVRHASSGTVEGLRIERTGTILAAPTVVLESASILLANCEITGGQGAGIEISGSPSRVRLERLAVFGNNGHGIRVLGGPQVALTGVTLRDNLGCGLLASEDAQISLEDSSISANRLSGLAFEGAASGTLQGIAVESNNEWGLHAGGTAVIAVTDAEFRSNLTGAVRASGDADLRIERFASTTDGTGLSVDDRAHLHASDGTITEPFGSGVLALSEGRLELKEIEIAWAWSHGVEVGSQRPATIDHLTLVGNQGDGIVLRGTGSTVTNTLLALNHGAGLRVESGASSHNVHHNALWRNVQGDYVGLSRRASDVTGSPHFINAAAGDFGLFPDSPCIGTGTWGETIGANPDPAYLAGHELILGAVYRDPFFGIAWTAQSGWTSPGNQLAYLDLGARIQKPHGSLAVSSRILGSSGSHTEAAGWLTLPDLAASLFEEPATQAHLTIGASGRLEGSLSYGTLWTTVDLRSGLLALEAHAELDWPSRKTLQHVNAAFGKFVQVGLRASAVDLVPSSLVGAFHLMPTQSDPPLDIAAEVSLVPDPHLQVSLDWSTPTLAGSLEAGAFVERPDAIALSAALSDTLSGLRATGEVHLARGELKSALISVGQSARAMAWSGAFTLLGEGGVRLSIRMQTDLLALLTPPPNVPPIPSWTYLPEDPEAGESIRFDASASSDSDGTIAELWWDFGDGELALGDRVEHTYREAGEYPVTLTISDNAGAPASLTASVRVWEADSAPAAAFTWTPISPQGTQLSRAARAGDAIRLDASASYAVLEGGLEYAWDIDSDGHFDQISDDPVFLLPPREAGHYPITLRVLDASGRSDAVLHVLVVSDLNPPWVEFGLSPRTPSILDPVRFIDHSSDSDGSIVSWHWAFGDGWTSREQEPIHRFETEGEYAVTLTVIDDNGLSATYERIVQVSQTPDVVPIDDVWALVVGISDYEDVPDLDYAAQDAAAIAEWIVSTGVQPDRVRLLSNAEGPVDAPPGVTTGDATLVQVREGLGWLRQMADQDDLVLIYFSGHGYRGPDDDGDESDGVDEFFVLSDTRSAAIDDTALRDDEFGRFLDRINSEHIFVLFDGCHSGGLSRSLPDGRRPVGRAPDRFSDLSLEGRLVLSATGEAQDAFESPALGHGVFTHFVLEGLYGKADQNGDEQITAWELYEYVRVEVPNFVRAERGATQVPQIAGEGETRIIVAPAPDASRPLLNYDPSVPFAGSTVRFWSQASGSLPADSQWAWSFGDGQTSSGSEVDHVYNSAGSYRVTVSLGSGAEDLQRTAGAVLSVVPAPQITQIDTQMERIVLSVGSQNGISLGDRFAFAGDGSTALEFEVVELIGSDASACEPREPGLLEQVSIGAQVQPAPVP